MVLVVGAGGFVGSAVVEELIKQGYQVRGVLHSDKIPASLKRFTFEKVIGDITRIETLNDAFKGVKQIFSCVGIIYERHASFEAIHVSGTRNLVRLALENKIEHFVHISALGTRANAVSRYHRTKYQGEQEIIKSGLAYTIFRPSIIFGPGDEFVNRLDGVLRVSPILPIIGEGKSELQPVYVRDLAYCATTSLKTLSAKKKLFEIGGPQALTLPDILQVIKGIRNYRYRWHPHIALSVVRGLVRFGEKLTSNLPVTSDQLSMLQEDNTCNNRVVQDTFGLCLTSLEQGLRAYWQN